jgi:hypothetical protein
LPGAETHDQNQKSGWQSFSKKSVVRRGNDAIKREGVEDAVRK